MPPQTRGSKTKAKENIGVISKTKSKANGKVTKQRNALADKTNSVSDNSSSKIRKNVVGATVKSKIVEINTENKVRPRRERKLPNRFNENKLLINLSNNKESDLSVTEHDKDKTSDKNDSTISTIQFKTPLKDADNSLIANRPKRICRLPSKFDNHSVSPNKFIPVGCHASTPIVPNKITKPSNDQLKTIVENKNAIVNVTKNTTTNLTSKESPVNKPVELPSSKTSSDTNNNAKRRILGEKKVDSTAKSLKFPEKLPLSNQKTTGKELLEKSFSFRVLENKKKSVKCDNSHLDVYEFTFDPKDEPPQKKKRKRAVKKKPAKPKTVVFKNNYDQNVGKALAALKKVVSNKPAESQVKNLVDNVENNRITEKPTISAIKPTENNVMKPPLITVTSDELTKVVNPPQQQRISTSTRVEDIEADFMPLMDHNDINYSPVTTLSRGKSGDIPQLGVVTNGTVDNTLQRPFHHNDPLNLQDNLSFFDDVPVASSSMNTSVKGPHASPWRVQFEQLPIKWHANTYVKPNMTPAVESSFINSEDTNKRRHVYTNLVPETNEALPEIFDNQSNLKQTSIISFIKEVVEKSASKKKKALMVTPTKANSLFEDVSNMSVATNRDVYRTPKKTPRRDFVDNNRTPNKNEKKNLLSNTDKENSSDKRKNNNKNNVNTSPNKDKDGTFFGFDESEDQENVSPVKIDNPRVRALRPRARAVLQEINAQSGPSRAKLPLAAKTEIGLSSDAVNKVYNEIKSATDAPVYPENNANNEELGTTQIEDQFVPEDDDSQSVHLFEDIEIVHHLKPSRKSYGKAKKVTFQQTSASDSDSQSNGAPPQYFESSDEDDLADLTFTMPNVAPKNAQKKRTKKKKQLSKKEKAEMEAWAAQFNSMCEDVEEFPLVVE